MPQASLTQLADMASNKFSLFDNFLPTILTTTKASAYLCDGALWTLSAPSNATPSQHAHVDGQSDSSARAESSAE